MADECPKMALLREVTCSICLDYFIDPYTVDCGHHFCRSCITQCLMESTAEAACPQCRAQIHQQNFKPNRDMVRFVEISKQMNRHRDWEAAQKGICKKHREPLKYFCRHDQVCICPVCDKSEGHEGHETIPVEDAALELKGLIFDCLDHVRQQRDKVMDYENCTRKEHLYLKMKLLEGKEKMTTTFIRLRKFLMDAELLMSHELSKVEKEIGRVMEENTSRALEKLSFFDHILESMAELCRLPEEKLLKIGGSKLQRWARERFDKPKEYPAALKWRVWEVCDFQHFMDFCLRDIRVLFDHGFELQYRKVNVTLDRDTAHPRLAVSEDCKIVQWVHQDQAVPDNPRRFDVCPCVLGCQRFLSGKVYWEVDIGIEGNWAFGVARNTLGCKGVLVLNARTGVYAIGKCGDRYFAFEQSNLPFPWKPLRPMRIRIYLDYLGARLLFADADQARVLFEFKDYSFDDSALYPFFWIQQEGWLKIAS